MLYKTIVCRLKNMSYKKNHMSFKVGLGISRTNVDSQWNLVYNAFHRIFCCGNETIRRQFCKLERDLDAANLRPVLEQGCRKQTHYQFSIKNSTLKRQALGNFFFRANLLYVPSIKMQRSLRSRSVHFLGTCEKKTTAQCQIPMFSAGETHFFSEVAIVQWFSFRKYPKSAQTQISILHFDIQNIQQIQSEK